MKQNSPQPRTSYTLLWVLCVMLFTFELFVFTWARVQCTNKGYEIHQAQEEQRSLISLGQKLTIELQHLKSLDRLKAIATKNMGLQVAGQEQIITIR